jgi:hypothetical protein
MRSLTSGPVTSPDHSEAIFQAKVIQIAKMNGWMVFHPRRSQTKDGRWLTAISGDAGFPDLVMAHRKRGVIYAELKTDRGRVEPHQRRWLEELDLAGAEAYLWRPKDLPAIAKRLGAQ